MSEDGRFIATFGSQGSGGGGSANTIYSADDTIGSGRVATLTDTFKILSPSGSVGFGGGGSALLDVNSTTKGFLPPRLTTTQKNAIVTPSSGLQIYDSTLNQLSYYNGTAWVGLVASGGSANTIYSADEEIGSGRVATLTDTLTFSGGETKFSNIALSSSPSFNSSLGTIPNISNVVGVFSFDGTSSVNSQTTLYVQNNISNGATKQYGVQSKVNGYILGVETASLIGQNGGGNLEPPFNTDVGLICGFTNTANNKNVTSYGLYSKNESNFSTTNIGGYFEASGGSNNYALLTNGGQVGFGTITPNVSSLVDITSTTQGFLPPRMTTTQKNAIGTPSSGLQVYDNTLNQLSYYNGSAWVSLSATSGDGIYSGNGSLSGDTIVTIGASNLKFNTSTGDVLINSSTSSSLLQISSTTQGFLPPIMTTTQKNAIGTPSSGLQVYDSTLNQLSYYNGTAWVGLVASGGGGGLSLRNVSSTDTFATANETINCTANTFIVNLPTAIGIQGTTYTLVNSGSGTITLDANGTETINGSLTIDLVQYVSRTVQSDNTNWIII